MTTVEQETQNKARWAAKEEQKRKVRESMAQVDHKIVVLSGKGGVGKSTAAANLAWALAESGSQVGLLDVDIHGPSIPVLLGLQNKRLAGDGERLTPIRAREGLSVVSIGFLMEKNSDAVIWRGPLKFGVIRQFLSGVAWGRLNYLVIDCPPGTGDEPLSVAQLIGRPASAIVVTTPNELAVADVRRCVTFCRKVNLPVLGIVENMSGFVCPQCGYRADIFGAGGGERLAAEMNVPLLGRIPFDLAIGADNDVGRPSLSGGALNPAAGEFRRIVRQIAGQEA